MDIAVAFGKVIRRLRKSAGLTQEELGLDADIRRTFVSLLELGQQQPTLTTIIKLSAPLGVTAAEIVAQVEQELAKPKSGKRGE